MSDNPQKNRGVVISGGVGCGKTAVLEQLLEQSAFETGVCGLIPAGKRENFNYYSHLSTVFQFT